jgi:hypothetical protein
MAVRTGEEKVLSSGKGMRAIVPPFVVAAV